MTKPGDKITVRKGSPQAVGKTFTVKKITKGFGKVYMRVEETDIKYLISPECVAKHKL